MVHWLILSAALLLVYAGPLSAQQSAASGLGVECDVYRALLGPRPASSPPIHVVVEARGDILFGARGRERSVVWAALQRMKMPIDSALAASYGANNAAPGELHRSCFTGVRRVAFGFSPRGPDDERHSFTFSRAGFTPDLRQALVHTVFGCGGRCGNGSLVLLEREGERWVVKESMQTVVF